MNPRVPQILADRGQEGQHLVLGPPAPPRQERHAETLKPAANIGQRPQADLLVVPVLGPRVSRPLEGLSVHVDEAGVDEPLLVVLGICERAAEVGAGFDEELDPFGYGLVVAEGVVVGFDGGRGSRPFRSSRPTRDCFGNLARGKVGGAGEDSLHGGLPDVAVPVAEAAYHHAAEDVVKGLRPGLFLLYIVHLKLAVWRHALMKTVSKGTPRFSQVWGLYKSGWMGLRSSPITCHAPSAAVARLGTSSCLRLHRDARPLAVVVSSGGPSIAYGAPLPNSIAHVPVPVPTSSTLLAVSAPGAKHRRLSNVKRK
ncbi:hypothetical protein S7711_11083 [Stachybotrys chartarum IBT 7711]|uniref:Uncharacterized protein n=1 Tax=Stachybotrys chartarum (strain CBS 109288 / IBT 7711) TaxID=1280523 RepID=A0A084AYF4_STACB|nr:hypothetical protein S7711_11083 [Stachybotrys chartarum IBT 7711]